MASSRQPEEEETAVFILFVGLGFTPSCCFLPYSGTMRRQAILESPLQQDESVGSIHESTAQPEEEETAVPKPF